VTFFANRYEAGTKLAKELEIFKDSDVIVVAIPRGGVVVAEPVAQKLSAPLDIIVPRKIGMPYNPELAVGALSPDGTKVLNHSLLSHFNLTEEDLEPIIEKELKEIKRRMKNYRGDMEPLKVKGRHVILVDDGVATGYTMFASIEYLKRQEASEITVAIPVAPPDTFRELSRRVTRVVCLYVPEIFYSVGQFYDVFDQTTDKEVINILRRGNNNSR